DRRKPEAGIRVATGDDPGSPDRGDGSASAPHGRRQYVDDADQEPHRHALDRRADDPRGQDLRTRPPDHPAHRSGDRAGARDFRDDPTTISRLLVGSGDGPQVPLGQVADIQFSPGPPMIRSEGGYLYDQVSIDVGGRGRDVGSYVREAQAVVAREVKLPTGYWLRWSGQYEAIQRVKARLQVVVPLTLGIIALLLYLTFGTVAETAIVMLSLPFALVGGVWIMWLLEYNLSIAVAVGFIALAGVAAE